MSVTVGVLMFLVMLFTAAQTLFALHVASVADAAAYDAARMVARSGSSTDGSARASAAAHVQALLGNAEPVTVSFDGSTADRVSVTVVATPPTLVGTSFGIPLLDRVERTAVLRVEQEITAP